MAAELRKGGSAVYFKHPGIGDLIWHLPFLKAVAAAHPGEPVTVMCRPSTAAREVLATEPQLQPWYLERTKSNLKELTGCLAAFRAIRPHTVWVLDASSRPVMAAKLAGVKHINAFGFGRKSQERWMPPDGARLPGSMRELHPMELYWELAKTAGLPMSDIEPRLTADPGLVEAMRKRFSDQPRPWVFFGIGATNNLRRWPADHFGELAKLLGPQIGTLFWFGGPGDRDAARQAAAHAARQGPAVDITGQLSLPEAIALLSLADVYIGNCSGPLNMAAAQGVLSFGLFGGSAVLNHSPMIEPIIRDRFFPGMRGITPKAAAARIKPALARLQREPTAGSRG